MPETTEGAEESFVDPLISDTRKSGLSPSASFRAGCELLHLDKDYPTRQCERSTLENLGNLPERQRLKQRWGLAGSTKSSTGESLTFFFGLPAAGHVGEPAQARLCNDHSSDNSVGNAKKSATYVAEEVRNIQMERPEKSSFGRDVEAGMEVRRVHVGSGGRTELSSRMRPPC